MKVDRIIKISEKFTIHVSYLHELFCIKTLDSNTTNPALSGGKLDCCASGIGLHRKWVRGTL